MSKNRANIDVVFTLTTPLSHIIVDPTKNFLYIDPIYAMDSVELELEKMEEYPDAKSLIERIK